MVNLIRSKIKTLKVNRDQIINLIFSEPLKYLDEHIFENLCNNCEHSIGLIASIIFGFFCAHKKQPCFLCMAVF